MRTVGITILALPLLLAFGCAPQPKNDVGVSFREIMDGQILNPGQASLMPVEGMDGVSAARVVKTYQAGPSKESQGSGNAVQLIVGDKK